MPFKSEAQRRKFHAMAGRGEISQSKVAEYERVTKGDIPERVRGGNPDERNARFAEYQKNIQAKKKAAKKKAAKKKAAKKLEKSKSQAARRSPAPAGPKAPEAAETSTES